jgi:hypothetical protein
MKTPWRRILVLVGVPILVIVGALAAYTFVIMWQIHQVHQLCAEQRPGSPVSGIQAAIKSRGLWNGLTAYQFTREGGKGSYDEQTKTWDYAVPAPLTLGDTTCFISHNGTVVVSTKVFD